MVNTNANANSREKNAVQLPLTPTQQVLRRYGVVARADENAGSAVQRHAAAHHWKKATLTKVMRAVRDALEREATTAFQSLTRLNAWLIAFKVPPQTTRKAAVAVLKARVFINLYDLIANRYHMRHGSVQALAAYTDANDLYFPLKRAKADGLLRAFLQPIRANT